MLDEEPTDIFIRHRAVVLATLFGSEDEIDRTPEKDSESASPRVRSSSSAPGTESAEPRRSASGPRASEQINAMLSGRTRTRPATLASEPLPPPPESAEPPAPSSPQQRPSPPRRPVLPPLDQLLHRGARSLRKPKVALTAVAALAVVVILVLVTGTGGDEPAQQLVTAAPAPSSALPPSSAPADSPPVGANIKVVSAEATCPPGSTPGMDAFDGRPATAWSCGRSFNVDGQVLRIDLGRSYTIDSIGLVPGWDDIATDGTDQWSRYRTVSRVSYRFNNEDITTFTQRTLDQRRLVTTKITPPVQASQVVLTVLQSSGVATADTTAISTIVIHGH
ncbi:discoidin domain-containing protein [Nocardia brasiliensis]|uniref:discoidin domain-containing protein n=1 Tax=Nocardia brasiliensis TaxID=37326 RepID=UPI003D8B802A